MERLARLTASVGLVAVLVVGCGGASATPSASSAAGVAGGAVAASGGAGTSSSPAAAGEASASSAPASGAPSATASPGPATGSGSSPAGPPAANPSIPTIVADVEPSVVSIIRPDAEGSGVIWSADGLIVTNNHVVEGVRSVTIAFADGKRAPATVLATDPATDLAVVRTQRHSLPAATFADAVPPVGTLAIAIGNPLGFENSVTAGIVSGMHRSIPGAATQDPGLVDLVQTDAAISPGNSGGALVGPDEHVIGVNVAYIPPSAGSVSIGFAIPAPTVVDVVKQLLATGKVEHPYLGVQLSSLTPQIAQQLGVSRTEGAVVVDVVAGSPAANAGVQPGDIITSIDGASVATVEDLLAQLRAHKPGDQVTLHLDRQGTEQDVAITLGTNPG